MENTYERTGTTSRLVHLEDTEKIKTLLHSFQLDQKQKEKVNELRKQWKNTVI
ncbi:hypothetical protein GCM10011409_38530 [Lentibacillus populi]|uniref:Uncharacterized protein n=1 Tax=Lentibacillus populi TaxID=1827502 RepID=A0A9W5X744_9BACI|nr:hypothetical protein GCM10011409_38530 [Lentibacillus populi]